MEQRMNRHRGGRLRRTSTAVVLLLAAAGLAACGGHTKSAARPEAAATTAGDAFCAPLRKVSAKLDAQFGATEKGGDTAKMALSAVVSETQGLLSSAPAELQGPLQSMISAYQSFQRDYAAVGYDRARIGKPAFADDPTFTKAGEAVDRYARTHCGFSTED